MSSPATKGGPKTRPPWSRGLEVAAGLCWLTAFAMAAVYGASWWHWALASLGLISAVTIPLRWRAPSRGIAKTGIANRLRPPVSQLAAALIGLGAVAFVIHDLLPNPTDALNWFLLGCLIYGVQNFLR